MTVLIPILMYHSVDTQVSPEFQTWSVTPQMFDAHMQHLVENKYTPLSATQYIEALDKKALPSNPVVITFDDGFLDFHTNALPILTKYQIPATLYIATGYIGKTSRWLCLEGEGDRPMVHWEHIADIQKGGVEIGAHTHTHPQMDTLPLSEAKSEVVRSKQTLEDKMGEPVLSFAYPHGYHSRAIQRFVQEAGCTSACGVKHAMSCPEDDRYGLARLIITNETDVPTLSRYLKGTDLPVAPQPTLKTYVWRWVRWAKIQYQGRPCMD